jgi:hypothetical protein
MIYATFDNNGRVILAHNDDTVIELPAGAKALTPEQWYNRFNLRLVGEELTNDPIISSLDKLRSDKAADIDQACRNAIYAGFITRQKTKTRPTWSAR